MKFIKQLPCYHKWTKTEFPYLWDSGRTKYVAVKCVKCDKRTIVDIFDTPPRKWANNE